MVNPFHGEVLQLIRESSGTPTQHTFQDSYLGNDHPRYPISAPALRKIAKSWMREHREVTAAEFAEMLTSLIEARSSTEKCMAGILMDYATAHQRSFDPKLFDRWLDHLKGWAEVDAVCTGEYTIHQLPAEWKKWGPLLKKFCKSNNIHKRRASLVLLCSPVRHTDDPQLASAALENISALKSEKEVLITKAISWLLRSMVKHHKKLVTEFVKDNRDTLPAIAVRETLIKLKTGRKTQIIRN